MELDVRTCTTEEYLDALAPIWQFFGRSPDDETRTRFEPLMPAERLVAAWEDGRAVGGAGAFPFGLSVPGGALPCAGITVVGVTPTHRRRGILRRMIRMQLDLAHERGEPIAALWASEGSIYGRFGFGVASLYGDVSLPKVHSAFRGSPVEGASVRQVTLDEAAELIPPVYERVRAQRPGMMSRSPEWWRIRPLDDPEWSRGGGGEKMFAVAEVDGQVGAYAMYRHHQQFEHGNSVGKLQVIEAAGDSAAATETIWRYLAEIDWVERMEASLLPVDHELHLLVEQPRRLAMELSDALWIRVVDLGAAFEVRNLAGDGAVAVDVADAFCPWNAGVWRFAADGCERVETEPEVRLDIRELGSVFLGGFSFSDLARAGHVSELEPGALLRADALFATPAKPWCPEIF